MLLQSNFSKISTRTHFPLLIHGLHFQAIGISSAGYVSKTLVTIDVLKPRTLGTNCRVLFSTSSRDVSSHAGKLPWVASYEEKQERVQTAKSSAWEKSAENFFTKNGETLTNRIPEVTKGKNVAVKERRFEHREKEYPKRDSEESSMDERAEKPKWSKTREKYKPNSNKYSRSSNSRPEKFEVKQWDRQQHWGKKTLKDATESTVPKLTGQGIYGLAPVLSALTAGRREFYALYLQENVDLSANNKKKKDKKGFAKVLHLATTLGLKTIKSSKHDLNMVVENRPHQGLVLDASPLETVNIKELEKVNLKEGEKAPIWIALDEVTDPQNLGAIIRSAYFFGVDGVILCAKNSAPLTGVVSKASAGALELIEILSCKNMMQFLSSSADNGFRVLGGSVSVKANPIREIEGSQPTILVLGSEGAGLRPLVERECTQLVRIEGGLDNGFINGNGSGSDEGEEDEDEDENENETGLALKEVNSFVAVESLNVSVAAGVLLYHLVSSRNS